MIAAGEDISRVCQMCARVAQYNLGLSDAQVDQLDAIIGAIDALRSERNYFVHSRWEYVPSIRKHVGVRSQRPSPRANGSDVDELYYCTPGDAIAIADYFRTVGDGIERFIAETFHDWAPHRLARRARCTRAEAFMAQFTMKTPPMTATDQPTTGDATAQIPRLR